MSEPYQSPKTDASASSPSADSPDEPEQPVKRGAQLNLFLEGREEREAKRKSKESFGKALAPALRAAWDQGKEEAASRFIDQAWIAWVTKWPEDEEQDKQRRQKAKKDLAWSINFRGYRETFASIYMATRRGETVTEEYTAEELVGWEIQFETAILRWNEGTE
ncbi:hypothetical protein V5O48_012484 [Marasmius crinis-equi]|uniref:Uncharacterized protein n=1 Tax=Marasmius crinis-equi TaxID=585013 RepID=A0ABR3F2Q6_9AGAR